MTDVVLLATERPDVWLAGSRSRPGEWHVITNVGTGFEICRCPRFGYQYDCAHMDALLNRIGGLQLVTA